MICTALGSPLVPEVKMSMYRSSGRTSAISICGCCKPATVSDSSATTNWQSASSMSRRKADPRRVEFRPTSTSPANAAAVSRRAKPGVFSRITPMCGGFEGSRRPRNTEARRLLSAMWSRQEVNEPSKCSPRSSTSARFTSSRVTVASSEVLTTRY
ncbi:Uncharacterised protein [Mycobacteroides abscessus subsp. abscessus]|nr:Uncharacterised protein [Mycobacteroides abscessus subsp. abscessus]